MFSVCSQRARIVGWLFSALCVLFADVTHVAAQVPAPWTARDVGYPSLTGTTTYDSGVFTVSAGGSGFGSRNDQFHFVSRSLSGNTTIVARVDALTPADPASRVGLMFRSSLARNAAHGYVFVDGRGQVGFLRRSTGSGKAIGSIGGSRTAPVWLALKREGAVLTAYMSTDGNTWQTIGSASVSLGDTAYVGMAVAAETTAQRALTDISNVSFAGTTGGGTLPNGQAGLDIGSPTPAGTSRESQGTYTIAVGGADIGGTADQFHFVYRQITGDVEIKARINSLLAVDPATKAGVMIRGSLTSSAPYAFTLINGSAGYGFERRLSTGGSSAATHGGSGVAPGWVRLVRTGQRLESYRSADGTNWTLIESLDMALPSAVYVGMAVTSHNNAVATTATIDSLSVGTPAPANGAPTVTLTSPSSGAAAVAPASFTLAANASDPEGRLSRVDFLANGAVIGSDTSAPFGMPWSGVAPGAYTLTARVYDLDGGSAQSSNSATVTVTASTPNVPPTVSLTSPTAGQHFTPPATITVAANAADAEGRMARVDFYANNQPIGTDASAPYSVTWSSVAAGSYNVTAIAVDAEGLQTLSSAVSITVQSSTTNLPPTVRITSPTNGQEFGAGSNVLLTADAADPEGRMARVEFYRGNALLGTDTTAPYSIVWGEPATGPHDVYAAAYDAEGLRVESPSVFLRISTGGVVTTNGNWAVNFTASGDHATAVTSYQLNVYTYGANPTTSLPLATSDLGKPTPDGLSNISVDRTTFINALSIGSYTATVSAIGPGGTTQSLGTSFTR